jgi:hypothetical protein
VSAQRDNPPLPLATTAPSVDDAPPSSSDRPLRAGTSRGAFRISLNWTTGGIGVQALTVQLFSLGFGRAGVAAPVVLMFSLPVGAVAFLIVRRRAKAGPVEPAPPVRRP